MLSTSSIKNFLKKIYLLEVYGRPIGIIILVASFFFASLYHLLLLYVTTSRSYYLLNTSLYSLLREYTSMFFGFYRIIENILFFSGLLQLIPTTIHCFMLAAIFVVIAICLFLGRGLLMVVMLLIIDLIIAIMTAVGQSFDSIYFWGGVIGAIFNQLMILYLSQTHVQAFFESKKKKKEESLLYSEK